VTVLIVDNSPTGTAADVVEDFARSGVVTVQYVHVPQRGLSRARNTVLESGLGHGELLAMIDDDEDPEPWWLEALLECRQATGAGIVTGPVVPRFGADAPAWLVEGEFLVLAPYPDGAQLHEAISGNALLHLPTIKAVGVRFDHRYDRTGGEDQLFFRQAASAGVEIRYAANATVHETVPPERTTFSFLVRRELRKGNTLGLLAHDHPELGESWAYRTMAAGKWALAGTALVLTGAFGRRRLNFRAGVLRWTRAVGMIGGLFGWRYRAY
jgi:glycosyltransferase involved in cell wall biosynthesis